MPEVLPGFLFRSRRGICPTCGASLALKDSERFVKCTFCGGECSLERRLRKLDADLDLPDFRQEENRNTDTRQLAKALGDAKAEKVTCPGCGDLFEGNLAHEILKCPSCGTQSKIERRMVRPDAAERVPPQRRNHADFELQARGKSALKWDVQTEQLCWRVLNEKDATRQIALAQSFQSWSYINATLVFFLPHLLALAKRSSLALAHPICDCVGKLLCQDDARLYAPTLEACEPFAIDPGGSTELLHEIGLGNARGMKLLIDAADAASRAGNLDYASNAAWAAHYIIERNFDQHPIIAEIMLYRLLYVAPTTLGWMLKEISSGYGGYVFKDWKLLLEFIDDCAFERPDLVEPLTRCVRTPWAKNASEVRERQNFIDARLSKAGKAAALTALGHIDHEAPADAFAAGVTFVEPWLSDPELKDAAIAIMRSYIKTPPEMAPAIIEFVKRHGESLPDLLKREVHWKDPNTKLLDRAKCSLWYTSEQEPDFSPAVKAAQEAYDKGIRAAVEARYAEQEKCRAIWERARNTEVKIFDGPRDEKPTGGIEPDPPPPPEEIKRREVDARIMRAQKFMEQASQRYQKAMEKLQTQKGEWWTSKAFTDAQAAFMAASERMNKAAASNFQDDAFEDVK